MARRSDRLAQFERELVECRACPRLVRWREQVARDKRAAHRDEDYWGRPVPGMGPADARLLVLGLAPAAHGANRTGRMFTGDRSGDWLYAALHAHGFASQPTSVHRRDGLSLVDTRVTAVVHCAPPDNRPTPAERDRCVEHLVTELELLPRLRVVVALGAFAWDGLLRVAARRGTSLRPRPRFAHGAEIAIGGWAVLGSYHPSQQNTFTGRLTRPMFDEVFARARALLSEPRRERRR